MKEILLVGNPNSGKTTLFNSLTCSNEHVGNWHGVTVENKEKIFLIGDENFKLVDTPGIYSLCPLSFEEEVSTKTILKSPNKKIINICDKNNLARNLYLTLCLIEAGLDIVVAINEIDKKPIYKVDTQKLSKMLGVEVVEINAEKKTGFDKLKKALCYQQKHPKLPYLKTLGLDNFDKLKRFEDENFELLNSERYAFVDEILSLCTKRTDKVYGKSSFDKYALNKLLALPIFFLIFGIIFYMTFFSLGAYLSDKISLFLELIFTPILRLISSSFGEGWFYNFFSVGFFGGIITLLSFLPQVVLLFFFLSILEDSGYMARIAFVFEDILGKIGLSGKSIYTLLMGFGCSTTAIMTSRNMDDKNAKTKTAMLCPYMSCSAKIPIYTVIGGAFFGAKNIFVIMGLYFLGIVVSIIISTIFEKTSLKSKNQSFILEFPPYRMTSLRRIGKILWKNTKDFVTRVGTIMISMNIIIWILSSFSFKFAYTKNGGISMLESFGKSLAPVFAPLGFSNWAIVSSLLAGIVAKEIVVSSIAMFNGIDSGATKLISKSILLKSSTVFFASKSSVLSFLVFCLLYTPCISSIAMLRQEVGRKWTLISVATQFFVAYVCAFVIYNISFAIEIFGFWKPFFAIFGILIVIFALFCIFCTKKRRCGCCKNCNLDCRAKDE